MSEHHTNEPWAALPVYEDGVHTGAWFFYATGVRFLYADGDGNRDAVSDEDAYLIAFAPVMLHALRQIADHSEGDGVSIAQDAINQMARALAKRREDLD